MARIPSTAALAAFDAAARSLSFAQAADELHVTPGAVSRQIRALEDALGVALFRRFHKRVALTEAGRAYLADIRAPLAELAAATERVRARGKHRAVSIVAYPTFVIRWLIPRWGRLYDAHPGIDLQVTTSLNPVDFARDAYDMAVRVMGEGELPAGVIGHRLLEVDLFPVAAPEVARRLAQPADLAGAVLIHGDPRPNDWRRWLAAAGCDAVDPARGLRFESLNLAFQAAIEGLGVAIGVEALVRDDLRVGRLVRPFEMSRRARRALGLVYPAARAASPDVAAVRDWLLAEAG